MESIINDLKYNQTKEVSLIIQDINTGQIVGITATKKNEIIEAIKTNSYGGFIIKEILLTENSKAVLYLVDSKDSINNLNYRTIDNKEVSASLTKENIMETVAKLLIDRKKDERKKARKKLSPAELEEKERNGFKAMFTHRVVGPLAIGHVIGLTGYVFEYDPLIWIGVGLIGYGFFLMLRGD